MRGYLFQRIHGTTTCNLKEHVAVFWKRQNLIFSIVGNNNNYYHLFNIEYIQISKAKITP